MEDFPPEHNKREAEMRQNGKEDDNETRKAECPHPHMK